MNNNILVVGDLHLCPSLGYAEYVADGRIAEEKEILDFIIKQASDCDRIVFLGDQLNAKNNHSYSAALSNSSSEMSKFA